MDVFKGVTMIDQNAINTYRTDLYFPKYNCDKLGHEDQDIGYKGMHGKHIKNR